MIGKLSSRAIRLVSRGFAILGSAKLCYACNRRVGRFLPYRGGWKDVPPRIRALDVIGSDVENFSCPRCGAHDRERHLLMYFDRAGMWKRIAGAAVLHFAPERVLAARISNAKPARYVKADLFPTAADTTRDDEGRLQAFGQEDHVRLYGRDLFSRLEGVGFVSKVLEHDVALKDYGESLYGVNRREPFICMERPAAG